MTKINFIEFNKQYCEINILGKFKILMFIKIYNTFKIFPF